VRRRTPWPPSASRILRINDHPEELEEAYLAERLRDFQRYLGSHHPLTVEALGGRSPEGAATSLRTRSALASREQAPGPWMTGALPQDDPAIRLARVLLPFYREFVIRFGGLEDQEQETAAELGRARFAVYGTDVPPDASRSPRITDGVVLPYEYNGTWLRSTPPSSAFTTGSILSGPTTDWDLPDRWVPPPRGLDLGTPLNFISTADTYGGNSGSPAVTPSLEIVGLNFDRNIDGLSRDFIYLPERGRNIMVDVRAIKEAMEVVYQSRRIVEEILTHRLVVPTEAEACPPGEHGGEEGGGPWGGLPSSLAPTVTGGSLPGTPMFQLGGTTDTGGSSGMERLRQGRDVGQRSSPSVQLGSRAQQLPLSPTPVEPDLLLQNAGEIPAGPGQAGERAHAGGLAGKLGTETLRMANLVRLRDARRGKPWTVVLLPARRQAARGLPAPG
jgi:hypothetical protein